MSWNYIYWTLNKTIYFCSFLGNLFTNILVPSNFYFDLVSPFYFLKGKRYFSTCENLPNYSCQFGKSKSVFLQILHQFSVSSNITLLCLFYSNIIYFGQKEPIKGQIFGTFECSVKIHWILYINFETKDQFLFKFCIILQCNHA